MKKINEEVGIRNLKNIVRGKKNCEIFFHKDLDGVCSALAMKGFLKTYYDIECVDSHQIQYGGMEFAIKNHQPGNIPVLVDFAHSKPMFTIATDHHDRQVGAEDTQATYYKSTPSNVETISGELSYSDVFTPQDIELIKTVDSANFLKYDLKPEDIQNSIFTVDKSMTGEKNRFMMGFVVNRLLLAYKNKRITIKSLDGKREHKNKNILECMVLDCQPSLYSLFTNIRHYIVNAKVSDKKGVLAKPEDLQANLVDYINRMKDYRFIETDEGEALAYDPANWRHRNMVTSGDKVMKGSHFDADYGIIMQYGGGSMFNPGSYDRYVPFRNNPDANFNCIVWPMGLVQVSCNPFKEKKLKGINLGAIAREVMAVHEKTLKRILVSLENIKYEFETSQDWKKMQKEEGPDYVGVGFKFSDLKAFYSDCVWRKKDKWERANFEDEKLISTMDKIYDTLSDAEKNYLREFKIPVWELVVRNSGGHPSITNVQGFGFLKYNKRALEAAYSTQKYTDMMKKFAREFVNKLKEKIDESKIGNVKYDTQGVEFTGQDTNENYKYFLDNGASMQEVDKKKFIEKGSKYGMDKKRILIDPNNKKIIAKFENWKNLKDQ